MKKRTPILVALALALLLIVLIALRPRSTASALDPARGASNKKPSLESKPRANLPEASPAPETASTSTTKPLIANWSEVPCRYASFPAVIGGSGNKRRMTYADIHNTLNWEGKCIEGNSETIDHDMRCLGIIQTLDSFLVEAAGLPMENQWTCAHDPKEYFPRVFGLPVIPSDPAEAERARERLLSLLSSKDFAGIISRLPAQHRFTGLEEALATRAISMLGAWETDPRTKVILQAELAGNGSNSRKVAALNALIMQGEVAEARSWLASIKNDGAALSAAADGLVPPESKGIPDPESGSANVLSFLAAHVGKGRELDATLLDLFYSSSDPGTRAAFAASFAGRIDNEAVRQAVLEILRTGEPATTVSLLRQRPALQGNVEYSAALKELTKSKDMRVVTWAIVGLSTSGDPDAWRSIAPFLQHSNRGLAIVAVSNLGKSARLSKTECKSLIKTALAARKPDPEFEEHARLALMILN